MIREAVTHAAHGVDQRCWEAFIHLATQAADVDINHIGLRVKTVVPDRLQQHGARDNLVRVLHEKCQQTKFTRLQRKRFALKKQ